MTILVIFGHFVYVDYLKLYICYSPISIICEKLLLSPENSKIQVLDFFYLIKHNIQYYIYLILISFCIALLCVNGINLTCTLKIRYKRPSLIA